MNPKQEKLMIEQSAIAVMVICGICMYTFAMILITRTEWNIPLVAIVSLPIVAIPYLHGRLKRRKEQFEEDMRIGLQQFEENLKRK